MATQTHTVLRGENLSIIAKNCSVDMNDLAKENHIEKSSVLKIGQALKIPEKKIRVTTDAVPNTAGVCTGPAYIKEDSFFSHPVDNMIAFGGRLVPDFSDDLLSLLRAVEANERLLMTIKSALTKNEQPVSHDKKLAKTKGSKDKTVKIDVVKTQLKTNYPKEPDIATLDGVKLTQNEKRRIVAAVALCEMNGDGFGSINADKEFEGRKWGHKGIEGDITYSRIVHIGLSYGVIQFTQDSGSLGKVLKKMYEKDSAKFVEIFGGGDAVIAQSLITLTTTGHPNVVGKPGAHNSGLSYWASIRGKATGNDLKEKSLTRAAGKDTSILPVDKEIRGIRVQKLIPKSGETAIDIWEGVWKERFLAAGKVAVFQKVQLDNAVENYLDKVLPDAKKYKIRSALALAFLTACKVRGVKTTLLNETATELGISNKPFETSNNERKCVEAIAKATISSDKKDAKIGSFKFKADEARRAKILVQDDLHFLAEDHYDISTYA